LEYDAADSRVRGAMPVDIVSFVYDKMVVRDDLTGVTESFDFVSNTTQ
jgi:hypothetical protein